MKDRKVSLQLDDRGRLTIPSRIRQYYEFPDLGENDVWIEVTIHGLDSDKHPQMIRGES